VVPTSRPRHVVTETDRLATALDAAAARWPEDRDSRSRLLLHLVDEGYRALLYENTREEEARLAAIRRTSGALTGAYGSDYLDELREDWPA
jgi:hypothetical protein